MTINKIKVGNTEHDIVASSCTGNSATSTTANKVAHSLTIQGNGTTLTNGTYNGSADKTVNITPASIGAATTSVATTSANGLMASTDKTKLNATNIAYGTCSTAAATAAKVITISGNTNWTLTAGSIICVKFSATNTAENPTFNVNSTGAKSVWYGTAVLTTSSLGYAGTANRPCFYMYDGTQYVFLGWSYDANTTYTNVKLGHGYATCSTAAATTAKVGTLSSYTLVTGGIVAVKFTYDVPAGATLNINSKGAKAIYHKGAAIAAGVIKAGDTATFIYSTRYHLISIDRDTTYTSLKNPYSLTIQGNGTTLTNGTYDGSAAKTVNITASSVGAAAAEHTHDSITDNIDGLSSIGFTDATGYGHSCVRIKSYTTDYTDFRYIGLPAGEDSMIENSNIIFGSEILYSNDSGTNGTITLNGYIDSFTFIDIIFGRADGISMGSVRIYNPSDKQFELTSCIVADNGWRALYFGRYTISYTAITPSLNNRLYGSLTGTQSVDSEHIYITSVIGYR